MLVIIACWNDINYNSNNEKYELPHRIGLMLKHAGVSITVTSITDVVAFIIGASTVIIIKFKLIFKYFLSCTYIF